MLRLASVLAVLCGVCACLAGASPVAASSTAAPSTTTKQPMPTPTQTTESPSKSPWQSKSHFGDDEVQILNYHNENVGANGYNFAFETSDGVSRRETATVKHVGSISVEGSVSWVGPDGVQYTLNYLADEHGFQPQGSHLPVGPEAP